ncbi:MSMEG_1061 family FMN-dependent PPOX-type flavoprotein [Sciscionella sediminilitoris]|uniref:MSMEG_1061 family FMN-dependent PPOX-type flavoprotein n=1 Tax=Sciscionella sediminilitoris TaxID=1445613 RepID=UPI0004DED77A|nr:MSMEG_1061 family FMN-dependent PPOX-type flavoprotein [Sciscionella sp. SE31]
MTAIARGAAPARTAADDYEPIDLDRIREIIGKPEQFILEKKEPRLGEFDMRFIAHSTFFVLASGNELGHLDTSPKGDPPGSVKVLDPWTLAIPDRPGNKLADTFENVTRSPGVGMVFLVPGVRETVRVNGDAFITEDPELLDRLGAEGKPAVLATIVRIREVFSQCGKAVIRAKLWQGDDRGLGEAVTNGSSFATMATAQDAGKFNRSLGNQAGGLGAVLEEHYEHGLY